MSAQRQEYEGSIHEALWDFADEKKIRDDDYARDLINDAGDTICRLEAVLEAAKKWAQAEGDRSGNAGTALIEAINEATYLDPPPPPQEKP